MSSTSADGTGTTQDMSGVPSVDHFKSPLHEKIFRGLEAAREALGWSLVTMKAKGAFKSTNQWNKWQRGSTFELASIEHVAAVMGATIDAVVTHPALNNSSKVLQGPPTEHYPNGGLLTPEARLIAVLVDKQLDAVGRADVLLFVQNYVSTFRGGAKPAVPQNKT